MINWSLHLYVGNYMLCTHANTQFQPSKVDLPDAQERYVKTIHTTIKIGTNHMVSQFGIFIEASITRARVHAWVHHRTATYVGKKVLQSVWRSELPQEAILPVTHEVLLNMTNFVHTVAVWSVFSQFGKFYASMCDESDSAQRGHLGKRLLHSPRRGKEFGAHPPPLRRKIHNFKFGFYRIIWWFHIDLRGYDFLLTAFSDRTAVWGQDESNASVHYIIRMFVSCKCEIIVPHMLFLTGKNTTVNQSVLW